MKIDERKIKEELQSVLLEYRSWRENPVEEKVSSDFTFHVLTLFSNMSEVIRKYAPPQSRYYKHAMDLINQVDGKMSAIRILFGLNCNISQSYLKEIDSIINAEIFSDFLEMAEFFLESGEQYKHPAAFLIGGVLEEHLRKLSIKNQITILKPDGKFRSAGDLNSDLKKANVYGLNEQQAITSWLGIRNDADHAHWNRYSKEKIEVMLKDVRRLIKQYPA